MNEKVNIEVSKKVTVGYNIRYLDKEGVTRYKYVRLRDWKAYVEEIHKNKDKKFVSATPKEGTRRWNVT